MKAFLFPLRFIALFALILPVTPAFSVDTPAPVTADILKSRLKEVEASTSLDEAGKAALTEMLNNALGNLERARANQATTDTYIQAVKTAPEQAKEIRAKLDAAREDQDEVTVNATEASPFDEIQR